MGLTVPERPLCKQHVASEVVSKQAPFCCYSQTATLHVVMEIMFPLPWKKRAAVANGTPVAVSTAICCSHAQYIAQADEKNFWFARKFMFSF